MIDYIIESENSSEHWPHFDVKDKVVLDLGCGRWYTTDFAELSPIYFAKTAKLVVGVDCSGDEINFYKDVTKDNSKYVFESICINNVDQVTQLLKDYKVTAFKCDIEGAEEVLLHLTKEDLKDVEEFAIEYHSEALKQAFLSKVEEWGFTIKVKASFARTPEYMGVYFCSKF
jgi:SAM-dependent methyltransferase